MNWIKISELVAGVEIISLPVNIGEYVLISGVNESGIKWRDVGVYRGKSSGIPDFVDKYGATSTPTHWMKLPECPSN